MPETARSKPLEIWFQDEARVGQHPRAEARSPVSGPSVEDAPVPRAITRYIWSYIFGLPSARNGLKRPL